MNVVRPQATSGVEATSPGSQSPAAGRQDPAASAAASAAVEELVGSLEEQKTYREATHALRTGLRDARAEFSFLRVKGLRSLLKFLQSVAVNDSLIQLFCRCQSIPELQVVPVLFQHSFKGDEEDRVENLDSIFTVEPMKLTTPSSDTELALALRVLEGCCLIHQQSSVLAHQYKAIPVLLNILATRRGLEQAACLDALVALLLDSSVNQKEFETFHGIDEVAAIMIDKQVDENLRLRCGEFLLLFIGHVDGMETTSTGTAHDDLQRLVGEKSASLIWAASQFGSTLDPEERMTALHIQARRVIESLELSEC